MGTCDSMNIFTNPYIMYNNSETSLVNFTLSYRWVDPKRLTRLPHRTLTKDGTKPEPTRLEALEESSKTFENLLLTLRNV